MGFSPSQAKAALEAYSKALPFAILRGLRKGMPIAVRIAKTKYMERKDNRHPIGSYDPANPPPGPLGIRQGNLIRTIHVGAMRFNGKRVRATIEAGSQDVLYAGVHEFGATIRARNGPYLIFPMGNPGGGYRIVKTDQVTIEPRPFLGPALRDATPAIVDLVVREMRALARVTLKGLARVK